MPIYAREPESKFRPAPEGMYQAVCCDVWDPWTEESSFTPGKIVDKTRICWQLDVEDEDGKRYEVSSLYTLSLSDRSTLCIHLNAWRGRKFTAEEKRGFDLEKLIGVNCQIQVVHRVIEGGKTYANVQTIVPLGRSMTKIAVSPDYIRRRDQQDKRNPVMPVTAEEEVPF